MAAYSMIGLGVVWFCFKREMHALLEVCWTMQPHFLWGSEFSLLMLLLHSLVSINATLLTGTCKSLLQC